MIARGLTGRMVHRVIDLVSAAVRHAHLRLVLYLIIGLAISSAALAGFVGLGRIVAAGTTRAFDDWVLEWVASLRSPDRTQTMLELSALGTNVVLVPVLAAASLFLWLARSRLSITLLWVAVAGGHVLNLILKVLYHRPRPTIVPEAQAVASASFPSGHAMSSLVAYGMVAVLIGRRVPGCAFRLFLGGIALALSLLVGASRIYLGVHYPSDVLAGYAIGAAWVGFVASAFAAARLFEKDGAEP